MKPNFTRLFLLSIAVVSFCLTLSAQNCAVLTNPGFELPVQSSLGNNLNTVPTGWSVISGSNLIRVNGTGYYGGPDTAKSGNQYLDYNLVGTSFIGQSFSLTECSNITFGGSFSNREAPGFVNWTGHIDIENSGGAVVASLSTRLFTTADADPSSGGDAIWYTYSGSAVNLPAGTYTYKAYLGDSGNFDDATLCVTPTLLKDFGDLATSGPTTWPIATAAIPTCNITGGVPTAYDATTNPVVAVWAGNGVSMELATAGGGNTSANTDNFDDGLTIPSVSINGGYTYNFGVILNANKTATAAYFRLWFDWNNDGNFTNDNSLVTGSNSSTTMPATYAGSATVNGSPVTVVVPVKPPFGASPNYKVRLALSSTAVADVYRANSASFILNLPNGEIEDYNAPATILPIRFGNVSAEIKNCATHLKFETLSEQNNKEFEVLHSIDGNSWKILTILPSKGNSTLSQVYSYIDTKPAPDYNYYRIRQTDLNGDYTYSSIVTVRSNCAGTEAIVSYPNPVKTELNIVLPSGFTEASVRLMNAVGQPVTILTVVNGGIVKLNTAGLPEGVYLLQVSKSNKAVYQQKIIKE